MTADENDMRGALPERCAILFISDRSLGEENTQRSNAHRGEFRHPLGDGILEWTTLSRMIQKHGRIFCFSTHPPAHGTCRPIESPVSDSTR